MLLMVELTPGQEAMLKVAADTAGTAPSELVQKLLVDHLKLITSAPVQDPTLTLFEQWKKEDAQMTPEEAEEEQDLWEQFEKGINETREALEMRQL